MGNEPWLTERLTVLFGFGFRQEEFARPGWVRFIPDLPDPDAVPGHRLASFDRELLMVHDRDSGTRSSLPEAGNSARLKM